MHIQSPDQKRWIQQHLEGVPSVLAPDEQRHILGRLNAAEVFERFLHSRYVGQKRFGLEGAESAIVLLDTILDEAVREGLHEAVMGMAHRGRLNVLANIVGKSYGEIFEEFEGNLDPESVQGSGDVKYHKGASGTFVARNGGSIPVSMASNPSHLEAVDPVVVGMARAKQDALGGERGSGPDFEEGAGGSLPGAAHPAPRRRRLRRPGRGGRDPEPLGAGRLPHRRDRAHRHQQPARLHHRPRGGPHARCTRPTWPRWSRPRSST